MANISKYKKDIHCKLVERLALRGYADFEIAARMNISERTFNYWKKKYQEFLQSYCRGKENQNNRVKRSLFELATGYKHKITKYFCYQGTVIREPCIEKYPPNIHAIEFYLINNDENYKSRKSELTGKDGGPVKVQQLTNEELEAEIAKAEAELADTKPGKGKKPK